MRTLLLLFVAAAVAHPQRSLDVKTVQLCGSKLANVLSLVCEPYGGLNGPSNTASLYTSGVRREGIVDECCRRPCSWRTLLSYCANYTSQEAPNSDRDEHEEELDNRVIEMLFGPPAPRRPRRFGNNNKARGCMRRCKCSRQPQLQLDEGNRRPNDLNALGTVAPEIARPPVILRHV